MKKLLLTVAILVLSGSAFAALPPFFQSATEIKAVLENQDVIARLESSGMIDSIVRAENSYVVKAGLCMLSVEVYYQEPTPGYNGPAIFELHAGEAVCSTATQNQ